MDSVYARPLGNSCGSCIQEPSQRSADVPADSISLAQALSGFFFSGLCTPVLTGLSAASGWVTLGLGTC